MSDKYPSNFVLIDYENVQPKNLDVLAQHPFKVFVFVGASQAKLPFDFSQAMQNMGENGKYIKVSGNAKDALDFHIAYYIGELSIQHPRTFFHIISKDKGFDPLIKHLKDRKLWVHRRNSLTDIPILKKLSDTKCDDKLIKIVKNMNNRGNALPKTVKTLSNSINSLFPEALEQQEISMLIQRLQKRKHIVIKQNNILYPTQS